MDKIYNKILIMVFVLILAVPFVFAHREPGRVSDMENRTLADVPSFFLEDGKINLEYPSDFDHWMNDSIKFRTTLVRLNSTMQYTFFGRIMKDSLREGDNGHLYYVDEAKVQEYQHLNLLSENELDGYITSMNHLNKYLENLGIDFYYMQCYEKDAIYPEFFVKGVNQFGSLSKARQIVDALEQETHIPVAPVYESLISNKGEELLYFKSSDPAHWNERGAYLGYVSLIETIQRDYNDVNYLQEDDYNITRFTDKTDIYGFTYPYEENSLVYTIKDPQAIEQELEVIDPHNTIRFREYGHYYKNNESNNDLKILVIGDSYIRQFLKEYIAEGFRETLSIDWINLTNLDEVLELFSPDIIVLESSENLLNNTIPLIQEIEFIK